MKIKINLQSIGNVAFNMAFCNMFLLASLYAMIPGLSQIIPSSFFIYLAYGILLLSLVYELFKHPRVSLNTVMFILIIFCLVLVGVCGNKYLMTLTSSSSFWVIVIFCLYIRVLASDFRLYDHIRADCIIVAVICIFAHFIGVYSLGIDYADEKSLNYMSFGYTMTLMGILIMELKGASDENNKFEKLLVLFGWLAVILGCLYGNRGALIEVGAYLIVKSVLSTNWRKRKRGKSVLLAVAIAIVFVIGLFGDRILIFISGFLERNNIESRTLLAIARGSFFFTRRISIYEIAIRSISDNPFALRGPGAMISITDGFNAHNIVLQLCLEFGVIIGLITFVWMLLKLFYLYRLRVCITGERRKMVQVGFILLLFALIELMFSGTFYESNILWIGISIASALADSKHQAHGGNSNAKSNSVLS